jgi:hypothetical protein
MSIEFPPGGESAEIIEAKRQVESILEHLEGDLGIGLTEDVSEIYGAMQRENLLARVENIESVMECIDADKPIHVGSPDKHYANSVAPDPEGLRIALAEADAPGPVRFLIGLDAKSLIGFKSDHLEVSEIDDNEFDLRDTSMRKAYCRHVKGEIRHEDIRYIVLRIPRKLFPADHLRDSERGVQTPFIFRGASVPRVEEMQRAA